MKLLSVNVAQPTKLPGLRKPTGIVKMPAAGPLRIGTLGLEGDAVCNTKHHGGPDQAVYVYGEGDYAWWEKELGKPLEPGMFGENLTLGAFESADYSVGDRLRIGEAVLEISAPRIPCGTFARRMGDKDFPERFRAAERPGVYCRVIRAGDVRAGDEVRIERTSGPTIGIVEMFRSYYRQDESREELERQLAAPIASRARQHKAKQLRAFLRSPAQPGNGAGE